MVRLQLTNSDAMHLLRLVYYGSEAVKSVIATNPVAVTMREFGTKLDETIRQQLSVDTPPEHVEDLPPDSETRDEVLKNGWADEKVTPPTPPTMLLRLSFIAPGCQLKHELLSFYYYRKWTGVPLHVRDTVQLGIPQEYMLGAQVGTVYAYTRGNITEYRCNVDNLRAAITQTQLDYIRDTLQADGWVPDMDAALLVGTNAPVGV